MREPVAFVAVALSACTAVTTVTVKPDQLQALAGMGPNEERSFKAVDEDEPLIARGDDDVRVLVTPIGAPAGERHPSVQEEPWGKLYTLRWGPTVSLVPTDRGGSLGFPASDLTGAELQMNRYSGWRTTVLVLCIIGAVTMAALIGLVAIAATGTTGGG